jgi:hypothetical protein
MKRRVLVIVAAAIFLAAAAAALACTPQAYLMFGEPLDNTGTPADSPSAVRLFQPGETVTISGYLFEPTAATPVTLRWGIDGPVIAEVGVNTDGTWTTTFVLPADIAPGAYILSAWAYDASGQLITGLPARTTLTVAGPGAPGSTAPPPVIAEAELDVGATNAQRRERNAPPARTARAPTRRRPAAAPRRSRPAPVAPLPRAPAAPAPAVAETPTFSEVTPPAPAERSHIPTRTNPIRFSPAPLLRMHSLPRADEPGATAQLPVAKASERKPTSLAWPVLLLGALGFLLLGAAAGGAIVARRRLPVGPVDGVEAELQEIISEQRAQKTERVEHR